MNVPQSRMDELIKQRQEFLGHLTTELEQCQKVVDETTSVKRLHEETLENVKFMGTKVEHPSLLPLGRIIYVNGVVKHTGEYFLDKICHPNSYTVLETLDRTIKYLEEKIESQSVILALAVKNKEQVEDRIDVLGGQMIEEIFDGPKEIVSDRGVAVKTGGFYEIMEFEEPI